MAAEESYYEILGVGKNATDEELKSAFRQMARKYHPDINKEPGAEARFKEINEAYQVLSDPDKRAAYDRFGKAAVNGTGGGYDYSSVDFSDILGDLFGFGGFGGGFGSQRGSSARRTAPRRGADLQTTLTLDFDEAVHGVDKQVSFMRDEKCTKCGGNGCAPGTSKVKCKTCGGTGEVKTTRQTMFGSMVQVTVCPTCNGKGETISSPCPQCHGKGYERKKVTKTASVPAGIDTGNRMRMAGEGQPGVNNGPNGDLYIDINVNNHPFFRRHDYDIHLDLKINIAQATLGAEVDVPTVDGSEKITIPAGTQPGKIITLKGKGVPKIRENSRGDEKVIIDVAIPTSLTEEQRELMEKLALSLGTEVNTAKKGILDRMKEVFNGD